MSKKKSKKRDPKKMDLNKKKLKKKAAKKKGSKKKGSKKKSTKKKDSRKKSGKKENEQNPVIHASVQPKDQKTEIEDHSSKYNVSDAIKKLRTLKSIDELLAFTKGEQRLTITKVIPAAKNRLN